MSFRYHDFSHSPLPAEVEAAGALVLDAAFTVHSRLGPGLLESDYRQALAREIRKRGGSAQEEVVVRVWYDGEPLDRGLRLDLIVNGCVIVEVKAVEGIHLVHRQQLQSYLRHAGVPLGYLLNFHTSRLRRGLRRQVNTRAAFPQPPVAAAQEDRDASSSPPSPPSPSSGVYAAPKSQPSEQAEKCD